MTQHRLGQVEPAKASLARLRDWLTEHRGNSGADAPAVLPEVETLLDSRLPGAAQTSQNAR